MYKYGVMERVIIGRGSADAGCWMRISAYC